MLRFASTSRCLAVAAESIASPVAGPSSYRTISHLSSSRTYEGKSRLQSWPCEIQRRSFASSAHAARGVTKKSKNKKQPVLKPKAHERVLPKYDFNLPPSTTLPFAVDALRTAIEQSLRDTSFVDRVASWGIVGPELTSLLERLGIKDAVNDQNEDRGHVQLLLKQWSRLAVDDLRRDWTTESPQSAKMWDLENARQGVEAEGTSSLKRAIVTSFLDWLEATVEATGNLPYLQSHLLRLRKASDMRLPFLEHPAARLFRRDIHLHVGPTNSGKTYGALLALCKARTGCYAGPLRLLAHEVWDRINKGAVSPKIPPRPCNLITGEEVKIEDASAGLAACTVEMALTDDIMDVAVIDEIQMIGDRQRGASWTATVMGLAAKELHLCGEASVIPLIKKIAEACGDVVHVHEYERLSPLEIGEDLKGRISEIRKGDCVVAFRRSDIFSLKERIEENTGLKCALAYGALPPETKAEQAKLFNDPDNDVDVMVASDAIGMGLNLKIKRVVFQAVTKWNGQENIVISSSQIKQIAGRAGRYGTNQKGDEAGGYATTLSGKDIDVLVEAIKAPVVPITRACIQPSSTMLSTLSTLLPPITKTSRDGEPIEQQRPLDTLYLDATLLMRIDSSMCFSSSMDQQKQLGPLIESAVPPSIKLTISERERFANAPANTRDDLLVGLFSNMVRWYARGTLIKFENVERGLGMLDALEYAERMTGCRKEQEGKKTAKDSRQTEKGNSKLDINVLMTLESLHRGLTLYMWLFHRFPLAFCYVDSAEAYKTRTENAIEACLAAIRRGRKERLRKLGRDSESVKKGQFSKFSPSERRGSKNDRNHDKAAKFGPASRTMHHREQVVTPSSNL